MSRIGSLFAALVLVLAACGGTADTTTTAADGATTTAPGIAASAGNALVITSVDFDAGVVVITNTGDTPYDLTGHQLCNRPTYVALRAQTLAPGETIEVPTADLGLSPDSGEVGLYTARDFGNPDAIIRYVQWGEGDHGRAATAVEAGVWTSTVEFVPGGNGVLVTDVADPISPGDWSSI